MPKIPQNNEVAGTLCDELHHHIWRLALWDTLGELSGNLRADAILDAALFIARHQRDALEELNDRLERARRSCAREWRFVDVAEGVKVIG